MKWNAFNELLDNVIETKDWRPIEQYENLDTGAGVYIFANEEKDVKYIGKAGEKRMVDEIYNAIYRMKDKDATLLLVLYTGDGESALELEQQLIKRYNPPNNGEDLT